MFTLEPFAAGTTLTMRMDARPSRLLPRLMMPIALLIIRKAVVDGHGNAVKRFSQARAGAAMTREPPGR